MHKIYMIEALKMAKLAYQKDEVPVGAVIVYKDQIIARAHNIREATNKTIDHAEIICIEQANEQLTNWKLEDCTLYVTLEPCVMCAGAIIQSRIGHVVYGASDSKGGAFGSVIDLKPLNSKLKITKNILKKESSDLLRSYFKDKRDKQIKIRKILTTNEMELYFKIRNEVFVEEQGIDSRLEYDSYDNLERNDVLFVGAFIQNKLVGGLRIIIDGNGIKVGRVVVLKEYRNKNIGKRMMGYVDTYAKNNGITVSKLGAQLSAVHFYKKCGYIEVGSVFLDAGIEHLMMEKEYKKRS